MYRQIGDLASDIQALSHGLHPARLELLGLKAAVAGLCGELSNRHDVTIDVQFENIPEALPPEISLCLYRVLQEALQNVLKHSVSRHAHVSLNGQIDTINLTIKDSGPASTLTKPREGRGSVDQHEGAVEDRGRTAVHPVAAWAGHDDSCGRTSSSANDVYKWSRMMWGGRAGSKDAQRPVGRGLESRVNGVSHQCPHAPVTGRHRPPGRTRTRAT